MDFKICIDSQLQYDDQEKYYQGAISSIDSDSYLVIKSLSCIYPEVKREFIKINSDQNNQEKILLNLKNILTSKKSKNKMIVEISAASLAEYFLINECFTAGCIIDVTNVADKEIVEILEKVSFNDNIRFIDKYNRYSRLTAQELKESYNSIQTIVNMVKRYKFTPLEQLFFIYDLIREKTFCSNDNLEEGESRDINRVLTGNHIVCEGYYNLVAAVCTALNIENEPILWKNINDRKIFHISNLIYLNDHYYNIHGIYEMDITLSFKKGISDNKYLNNYTWALIPFEFARQYKKKMNIELVNLVTRRNSVGNMHQNKRRFDEMIALGIPDSIRCMFSKSLLEGCINISKKVGAIDLEDLCYTAQKEEINEYDIESIYQQFIKLNKDFIDDQVLIQSIYKVRRIEHLMNPLKYPLNPDTFEEIINTTIPKTKEQRLSDIVFANDPYDIVGRIPIVHEIVAKTPREKMMKDIKRIELLNTMKSELQNKEQNIKVKK